ncbi:hypothetical protein TIFTF001_052262 [Ficus carica]|uniref:Uncharacterized protein n=1 Tax=Ficus carica TaxID=3494 RepID=A0AA88EFY4_FICCA|nr:hypothetical protein TIFTF001_052262 [Ficus carica]
MIRSSVSVSDIGFRFSNNPTVTESDEVGRRDFLRSRWSNERDERDRERERERSMSLTCWNPWKCPDGTHRSVSFETETPTPKPSIEHRAPSRPLLCQFGTLTDGVGLHPHTNNVGFRRLEGSRHNFVANWLPALRAADKTLFGIYGDKTRLLRHRLVRNLCTMRYLVAWDMFK